MLFIYSVFYASSFTKAKADQNGVDASMGVFMSITQHNGSRDANIEGNSSVLYDL